MNISWVVLFLALSQYWFSLFAAFVYKNDSVIQVDKWGYYHCNDSNPIVAFNNGRSIFNLDRPGPFYFISGDPGHCRNGQHLIVEVMGLHHQRSHSPPSIANPPESYSAPSPQPSSGAVVSVRLVSLLVVLLATLVALLLSPKTILCWSVSGSS